MDQIVSAMIGAAVVIIAVLLTRRSETMKHFQSLRTAAYADFIRGVAGLAVMQRRSPQSEEEFIKGQEMVVLVADAKARIAIYGSQSVVGSLASLLRGGQTLDSPERTQAFTEICRKMRNDRSAKRGKVTSHDMHFLLFNLDLKDYLGETASTT